MARLLSLFCFVFVVSGCEPGEPSYKDIMEQQGDWVISKRDSIVNLARVYSQINDDVPSCENVTIPLVAPTYRYLPSENLVVVDHNWLLSQIDSKYHWPVVNSEDPLDLLVVGQTTDINGLFNALSGTLKDPDAKASSLFINSFKLLKHMDYLVVNQITHYQSPALLDESNFIQGEAEMMVTIMSLDEQKVLCKTQLAVETPENQSVITTADMAMTNLRMDFSRHADNSLVKVFESIAQEK